MSALKALRLRPRLIVGVSVGLLVGGLLSVLMSGRLPLNTRLLLGWNAGVWIYLSLVLTMMFRSDARHLQLRARALGNGVPVVLLLALAGALASLAALALELAQFRHDKQLLQDWPYLLLALFTVAGSWLLQPVEFAMSYARLYHRGENCPHGLEFPGGDEAPDYLDFLYFSITLAATSQTSDVTVSSKPMRRLVLLHAVVSFVFNTGLLALSINILASLLS